MPNQPTPSVGRIVHYREVTHGEQTCSNVEHAGGTWHWPERV